MEIISRPFNGRNYWKKKGYTLLDGAGTSKRHRNMQVVRIGGGSGGDKTIITRKRQLFWRIKRAPKVLVAMASPKRLWKKFSDSYIKFMLRMAGQVGQINGGASYFDGMKKIERSGSRRRGSSKQKRLDEFETRLVLEIYKALSTSQGLSEAVI